MSTPRAWTRPRLLLALLLAALVAGAVPLRLPSARGDKASGAASWRAASARPVAPRPDLELGGAPPLAAAGLDPLPLPRFLRPAAPPAPRVMRLAPAPGRSPLPRAPPLAWQAFRGAVTSVVPHRTASRGRVP